MRGLLVAAALAATGPAMAQMSAPVHFEHGKSGAVISGTVTGHDYMDYVLGAAAGQHMSASLKVEGTNGHGIAYFNILPPGSDGTALFVGSMSDDGRAVDVVLPESGDYVIRVYLMGNDRDAGKTVGYALSVSIR